MNHVSPRRADRAREIIAAAISLFATKGFAATSIEQIAVEAGIGKSTVYEYYPNKEELFIAVIQKASNNFIRELAAIGEKTEDTLERLTLIAELFLSFSEARRATESRLFCEVINQTMREGGIFFNRRHFIRELTRGVIRVVSGFLLEGVSRGHLKPEIARDAEKIAINYLAYLDGIQLYGRLDERTIDSRCQVKHYLDHFLPLLVGDRPVPAAEALLQ